MSKKFYKSGLELRSNSNFRSNALVAALVCDSKDISYEALSGLALMLKLASKSYKDEHGLTIKLMNLCDSILAFGSYRYLDKFVFEINIGCPVDKYVGVVFPSLQGRILSTYSKIIKNGFLDDKVALTLTQGKLLRENADYESDPSWLSLDGLKKNFLPDINFGFLPNGNDAKIKSLSFEELNKALEVVRKAKAYVGCVGFEKKGGKLHSLFNLASDPLIMDDKEVNCADVKDISLIKDGITSSAVAIGYGISLPKGNKGLIMRSLLSKLLCDDSSPLFLGLREERGLTYGVRAIFPDGAGCLIVSMTLDKENASSSIKVTDSILSEVADKIDEKRLSEVNKTMTTALEGTLDNPYGYANFLTSSLVAGLPTTVEGYQKLIDSITLEDVKDALKTIKKAGSFTVNPSEEK